MHVRVVSARRRHEGKDWAPAADMQMGPARKAAKAPGRRWKRGQRWGTRQSRVIIMNGVGMRGLLLEAKGKKGPPPCFFRGEEGPGEICRRTCIIGAYFYSNKNV